MNAPHGANVPSIKYFGTSWYERGVAYWRRRLWLILLALLMVGLVLLTTGIVIGAVLSLIHSATGRWIALVVIAIPVALSFYSTYRRLRRTPEDRALNRRMSFAVRSPRSVHAGGAAGTAAGVGAVGGGGAGALIAVGNLFIVGTVFGYLAITLGKYVSDEEWSVARRYGHPDR